jgi:thioesterase domain-containing protein/acyl carrier protein
MPASQHARDERSTAIDVLHRMLAAGVLLRVEGDVLCWKSVRGVLSGEQRDALRAHKPALLQLLEPGVSYLPLLPAQKRIWLQCRVNPDSAFYLMPAVVYLTGDLNVAAFADAVSQMRRSFEAWRTTFPVLGGLPMQAIHPPDSARLLEHSSCPVIDLSALLAEERMARAELLTEEFSRRPFDLEHEWGNRFTLLRLAPGEHRLVMSGHHIYSDRWSLRLVWRELGRLYNLRHAQGDERTPDSAGRPAGSWIEYVISQQTWLESEACERQIEFWRPRLQRALSRERELAPDSTPAPVSSRRSGTLDLKLPVEEVAALKALARQADERATLHTILTATLALALHGVGIARGSRDRAGNDEIRIGSVTANRNGAAARRVVGLLVNTVTLLFAPRDDSSFLEWLQSAHDEISVAHAHQDVPFETLLERLGSEAGPEYSAHGSAPFQVFFVMQNISMQRWQLQGVELLLRQTQAPEDNAKFDLTVSVHDGEDEGLRIEFIYNAELFQGETVAALVAHYASLLRAACENPELTLNNFPQPPAALRNHRASSNGVLAPPHFHVRPSGSTNSHATPELRDAVEDQLAEIWQRLLNVEVVRGTDNFFDLGGHSMLAVRLLDEVETQCGVKLPLANFFQTPTLAEQAALLRHQIQAAGVGGANFVAGGEHNENHDDRTGEGEDEHTLSDSLVVLQEGGSLPPLFCIDGVVHYRTLARHLGPEQPVYGLIPATRTSSEWFPVTDLGDRVAHYTREIQRVQPQGPYFLAGLSFAGLVAFRVAHQLRAAGERVALLVLFDTYGPGYFNMSWRQRLGRHWKVWAGLETKERVRYIGRRVRSRWQRSAPQVYVEIPRPANGATADEVGEEAVQIDILQRALTHDECLAIRNLVLQARDDLREWRYDGRLLLFTAQDNPREFLNADPLLGWSEAASHIEVHPVPGDHTGILREPNVQVLAAHLQAALREARSAAEAEVTTAQAR